EPSPAPPAPAPRAQTTNGLSPPGDDLLRTARPNPLIQKEVVIGTRIAGGCPMLQFRWGLFALVLAIALALACGATLLAPPRYLATGGVLMPAGMLRAQYASPDPQSAAALVQRFIEQHDNPLLVDPPVV